MADPFNDTDVVRKTYFKNNSERDSGTPSNDAGHVPQAEADGYLHRSWMRDVFFKDCFDRLDGTTTPVPVFITPDETILAADANVAVRQGFHGFVTESSDGDIPTYLGGGAGGASFSLTAPAGNDRYLLIFTYHVASITLPSTVTWNGFTLTNLESISNGSSAMTVWGVAIGDAVSGETFTLAAVGSAGSILHAVHALVYDNVDQSSPIADSADATAGPSTSVTTAALTTAESYSLYVYGGVTSAATINAVTNERENQGDRARTGDFEDLSSATLGITAGSSGNMVVGGVALRHIAPSLKVFYGDILGGFSGLSIGLDYYVSDAIGTISTTPGTNTIKVGKAVSATEILITH